jgi:hypothetical protein
MMARLLRALAASTSLLLAGCFAGEELAPAPTDAGADASTGTSSSSSSSSSSGSNLPPPPPEAAPGCNPVLGDDCVTPFPSTFYEVRDPTTATGYRVLLGTKALPAITPPLSPDRYDQKDGFSPATPFVVYFADGVDTTQLPTIDALDQTVNPTSVVQVLDYETGERVPVFAEMDLNSPSEPRHALLIRPQIRLQPERRYVVALVGLNDANGVPLAPAPFVALRDQNPLSKSLEPLAASYEEIFAALEQAGVDRSSLTLAFDVVTASDATATSHLQGMLAQAIPMSDSLTWTVTSSTDTPDDPNLFRKVVYSVQTPSFLADASGHSTLDYGPDGQPMLRGIDTMPVIVQIPQCALTATGPLPVIVFGHGLFSTAEDELATPLIQQVANQACVVFIGTDWIGLSSADLPVLGEYLPKDLNNVYLVTDRLQQAHVNIQVMTHLFLTKLKDDPALAVNGKAVTDASDVAYFGISDGGIQGATFMALTPDVERGALNVPGCEWSLLIYRSVDFADIKPIVSALVPDPVEIQTVIALLQSEWDYTDPATYAPHLLHDPLPGLFTKRILLQESIGDAQVTNLATRVLARTMGIPGLDLIVPVYGVGAQPAPLDSAYTQWNSNSMPLPPTGDLALPADNGAHDAVYQYPPAQQQLLGFLAPGGQVQQTCSGPCNF